jgi:hypothetical protein
MPLWLYEVCVRCRQPFSTDLVGAFSRWPDLFRRRDTTGVMFGGARDGRNRCRV